ncbi:MAG: ribonuclease III [Chloroflexi bacterium RBG_16_64_43]|nr:MAG: ribonuclease III [Chloroflexi bacterium RBG_16_64_43]
MSSIHEEFERRTGLRFDNQALLERALTHHSYVNEHSETDEDNERLEFLGDAVLDFLSGSWLYARYPQAAEGELTRLRSALVRTETLAEFARSLGLGSYLRLGRGEEESGGRSRPLLLCGAFEALTGALYLDRGEAAARQFAEPMFESVFAALNREEIATDAKSRLQEWAQSELTQTPQYRTVTESGPHHSREFTVEVLIGGELYGSGLGRSKNAAAQEAAAAALRRLGLH